MTAQTLPNSPVMPSINPLWIAVVVAVIVHLVIMVGMQTHKPIPLAQPSKSINITLVNAPITKAPDKAQMLAAENQLASSQQTNTPEPEKPAVLEEVKPVPKMPVVEKIKSTPPIKPLPKKALENIKPLTQEQPIPKVEPEKVKPKPQEKPVPKVEPEKVKPQPQEKPIPKVEPEKVKPQPQEKPIEKSQHDKAEQKIITQQKAEWTAMMQADTPKEKIVTRKHSTINTRAEQPHHVITAASLQQQISEMGTGIRQARPSFMETKTKNINQVSANKYVAAQYLKDWETKVERVGNNNYPAAATKAGFSATLTMDVFIKADGSIDNMRITHSSGNPELDEQAKNIVRMSAPFPPLPEKLRSELDVLVITRSWKFSDESGLITQ